MSGFLLAEPREHAVDNLHAATYLCWDWGKRGKGRGAGWHRARRRCGGDDSTKFDYAASSKKSTSGSSYKQDMNSPCYDHPTKGTVYINVAALRTFLSRPVADCELMTEANARWCE